MSSSSFLHAKRSLFVLLVIGSFGIRHADAQRVPLTSWSDDHVRLAAHFQDDADPLPAPLPPVQADESEQEQEVPTPLEADEAIAPSGVSATTFEPPLATPAAPQVPAPSCATHSSHCSPAGHCLCCRESSWSGGRYRGFKRHMQYSHWGFPEFFVPTPLGASVAAAREAQILQGLRDQSFLHHVDFYPDDTADAHRLTPYGERRLYQLANDCMMHSLPLFIESAVGRPQLDQARREFVIGYSQARQLGLPDELIVLADQYRGVSGAEAVILHRGLLGQTQGGGTPSEGASAGTGTLALPVVPLPNAR